MVSTEMPPYPDTPDAPFSFPNDILQRILVEYYKHEFLTFSNSVISMASYYHNLNPKHRDGPLAKYKKYLVRRGQSILNVTSLNQNIRKLALPYLASYVYFDLNDQATTTHFLNIMEISFIRQARHIITRATHTDMWAQKLFQQRFPALKTLTIYEDLRKDKTAKEKFSVDINNAHFWNTKVEVWQYTKKAQAVVKWVKKQDKSVVDARASRRHVVDVGTTSIVNHGWSKVRTLLATKEKRSFVVELARFMNWGMVSQKLPLSVSH